MNENSGESLNSNSSQNNEVSSSNDDDNRMNENCGEPPNSNSSQNNEVSSSNDDDDRVSWRWCHFMTFKIALIVIRYIFRLLIVPLLQLQLLNDYAWNCIMNNVIRSYCRNLTSTHYAGLDHSL